MEDGEEDEREERGVGELSDEDDIEGEHHQLAKQGKKGKKKNASAIVNNLINLKYNSASTGNNSPNKLNLKPKKGLIKGNKCKVLYS